MIGLFLWIIVLFTILLCGCDWVDTLMYLVVFPLLGIAILWLIYWIEDLIDRRTENK